jgi:hypothetical protein
MAKGQRKIRPEFWIGLIFVALLAYALIADWWKEHATLGWIIVGVIVAILAFSIYRFPVFRRWLSGRAKKVGEGIVYETEASGREPVPPDKRMKILQKAKNRCENPDCRLNVRLDIHHIDFNNSNNSLRNLIALCPSCHRRAHDGEFSFSQLRNWAKRSWAIFNSGKP